jgi:hypothetical protein
MGGPEILPVRARLAERLEASETIWKDARLLIFFLSFFNIVLPDE